jgi:hypothetical protein
MLAEFSLFYTVVPDIAWQVLTMFTAVLAALGTGLLGHLLGFHIFLSKYDVHNDIPYRPLYIFKIVAYRM